MQFSGTQGQSLSKLVSLQMSSFGPFRLKLPKFAKFWSVSAKTFDLGFWWPCSATYHSPGDDCHTSCDNGDDDNNDEV